MSAFGLAWSNLLQNPVRAFFSVVGVAAAVVLVFMQLGFLDAVDRTASLLYDHLEFDLLLASSEYRDLNRPSAFPRTRLAQARAAAGVEAVYPLTTSGALWRDPRPAEQRGRQGARVRWSILVLAVEPGTLPRVFRRPVGTVFRHAAELARLEEALGRLGTVAIDRSSRPEYGGPAEWRPGSVNELNDSRVEIAGDFRVGTGFGYNGLLLTSEATFARATGRPPELVTFGLVRLAPGTDPAAAGHQLKERLLPDDVQVFTRDQLIAREREFWLQRTAVGQFFVAGVVIALVVGAIFVYQMMANDVRARLPEFATVKALGYPGSYLSRVVILQGVLLALFGYLPGLLASLGLYALTGRFAHIPIGMTGARLALVLALTAVMCLTSAVLALRRVWSADPANLF